MLFSDITVLFIIFCTSPIDTPCSELISGMGGNIPVFFTLSDIYLLMCFFSESNRSENGWFIPVAPSRAVHVHLLSRTMCVSTLTWHIYSRYKRKVTKCCSIPLLGGELWKPEKKMFFICTLSVIITSFTLVFTGSLNAYLPIL